MFPCLHDVLHPSPLPLAPCSWAAAMVDEMVAFLGEIQDLFTPSFYLFRCGHAPHRVTMRLATELHCTAWGCMAATDPASPCRSVYAWQDRPKILHPLTMIVCREACRREMAVSLLPTPPPPPTRIASLAPHAHAPSPLAPLRPAGG